jgi:2'-5' RNA ligase
MGAMTIRLFAALSVPDDVAARLGALQRGVGGARWSPRENLHLTLQFFGDVTEDRADDLDAALGQVARARSGFDLRLKGAGFFGGADPRALFVAAAPNDALNALAGGCARAARQAGLRPEKRKYTPHVTLAYLTGAALDRVIAFERNYARFESHAWAVQSFGLYSSWRRKSAPNLYRLEADYPLLARLP